MRDHVQAAYYPFANLAAEDDLLVDAAYWSKLYGNDSSAQFKQRTSYVDAYQTSYDSNAYAYSGYTPPGANYSARIQYTGKSGAGGSFKHLVMVRAASTGANAFSAYLGGLYYTNSPVSWKLQIYKCVNGSTLSLLAETASTANVPPEMGLRIEVHDDDSSNIQLALYRNETDPAVLTASDADVSKITAKGQAGIYHQTGDERHYYDDFYIYVGILPVIEQHYRRLRT